MKIKELLDKVKAKRFESGETDQALADVNAYSIYDEEIESTNEEVEYSKESELNTINQDIPSKRTEIIKPVSFSDAAKIADELKVNKIVLIDLSELEKAEKRRIIDFISGVIYINDGIYKKIEGNIYKILIRK
ncbi:cell division protein SepF [Mesoplasma coleopterae]|uniref:Cell division protein SepF n=1 Tax=Mesoplasma coleopterae TaxID=324078 RepID=A0A2K8P2G2_9MOLU|nr:cell division protein SepF [Mesoplasma coleopterae]ATZ20919.1 cell division protein SepF [Mesoplasma coleopterae]